MSKKHQKSAGFGYGRTTVSSDSVRRFVCDVCQGIGEDESPRIYTHLVRNVYIYVHYPNGLMLLESARRGCHVCEILLDSPAGGREEHIQYLKSLQAPHLNEFDSDDDILRVSHLVRAADFDSEGYLVDRPILYDEYLHLKPEECHSWAAQSALFGQDRVMLLFYKLGTYEADGTPGTPAHLTGNLQREAGEMQVEIRVSSVTHTSDCA